MLKRWLPVSMIAVWVIGTLTSILAPQSPAAPVALLLTVLAPVVFGLAHGAGRYGLRASMAFFIIALVLSNGFENLSIATGFPFGFYTHTALMGPKLFLVPVIVGPSYYGLCYIAWVIANSLLGDAAGPGDRQWTIAMPLAAAFIVVGADICVDPMGSTLGHRWIYAHSGAFFGVPLSNYLGWFLTTWVIFQVFALYLAIARPPLRPVSIRYNYEAAAFWAAMALQYPLILIMSHGASISVQDSGGWTWRSGDILQTATMTSIYTMLAAAVTSALVSARRDRAPSA